MPTDKINPELFNDYVDKRLVTRRDHPKGGLYIWNYTPLVQFSRSWDDVTTMCRGLITDLEGRIKARPFSKFFNYGEYQGELPDVPFQVSEKMDGSLGIMYTQPNGTLALATRGSFSSDQALKGTQLLWRYLEANGNAWVNRELTYLFEIIYPANRIVVDYGSAERLVLLAAIHTKTGIEVPLKDIDYPDKVQYRPGAIIDELQAENRENSEGYVIRFDTGLRLKVKFDEYVRLHRILTNVSTKNIWEALKGQQDLNEILDKVPDEFYKWVKDTIQDLTQNRDEYISLATTAMIKLDGKERREIAVALQDQPTVRAMVFAKLDGKDTMVEDIAWKAVKPEYSKPFKEDIDA